MLPERQAVVGRPQLNAILLDSAMAHQSLHESWRESGTFTHLARPAPGFHCGGVGAARPASLSSPRMKSATIFACHFSTMPGSSYLYGSVLLPLPSRRTCPSCTNWSSH